MKAMYILWLRQIIRYVRSRSRIIGSMGQPLLFLLAFGYGFGPIFSRAGQGNYIQFLTPGIIAQSVLFVAMFSGVEVIFDRQFGFLKETFVAPVSRLEIILGRSLGGATVATFQGILVLLVTIILGFRPVNWLYLPFMLLVMFLIALLFTSLGTAIATTMEDFHGFQLIMSYLIMPLFFLSGALFPLTNVPILIKRISQLDPLTYGVDALRFFLNGSSQFNIWLDIGLVSVLTLLILAIASYLFSKMEL